MKTLKILKINFWTNFKLNVKTAAESTIGRRRGTRKDQWISNETWELIDSRKNMKALRDQAKTTQNAIKFGKDYNTLNKAVKRHCKTDKKRWTESKCEEAEKAATRNDSRSLYKIVRDLTGSRPNCAIPIKDKSGKILLSEQDQNDRWVEHFSEVLNQPTPLTILSIDEEVKNATEDLNITRELISKNEIKKGLTSLSNNKAAGLDCLPAELLKCGGDAMVEELTNISNIVWKTGKVPDEWKCGVIVKLPKKGDLGSCDNWRGITLLVIVRKLICWVLLKRIQEYIDVKLREEQAGFREQRSCHEQIFTLRNIIEQSLEFRSPLIINYVDFKKAFDSIYRPTLWQILKIYGIPQKYIDIFREMYTNSRCCVKTNEGNTTMFKVETGVQQGDIPSPFFFLVVVDYLIKNCLKNPNYGIPWGNRNLTDLDCADDLALLAKDACKMQDMTNNLKIFAEKVGLRISSSKTKVQKIGTIAGHRNITLNGAPLEEVNDFSYLGSIQSNIGDREKDIKCRIGKGCSVFRRLNVIWYSKSISLQVKLRFYKSIVLSTVLYACETWKSTTATIRLLDVFHMNCLRKILNLSRKDHVRNNEILRRTNFRYLSEIVLQRRLQFTGHVLRMSDNRPAKKALNWILLDWKRSCGKALIIAEDRDKWKKVKR